MGFLDKLKSAAKFVTGGGAKVSLEVIDPAMDRPFTVKVHATVDDAELKIDHVYLHIRAEERITLPKDNIKDEPGEQNDIQAHELTETVQTFKQELKVSGADTLAAGGEFDWEVQVTLPSGLNGSYYGRNALHRYYALAGLDARGNDPDSGWVEFRV